jgi:glycosyltransferase involved in cell wall biosynthesis
MARCARAVRPDLLQGWMYHGNLAATFGGWALARPLPVLWNVRHSLHDLAREKPLTRAIIRLGACLSRLPRAIVYNSRISAGQHERLGYAADKTVVIPNGFDCQRFRPRADAKAALCRQLGIEPGATIVGMIGRDHPMKDPVNLISALGRLAGHPSAPHLIIVGRGFDQHNQMLVQALQAAGCATRATLLGPRDDIPAIVAGFDIAVLPSAWGEGFPNVLGEAMASGVPCVATDVGDCGWIVGDAGLIVPPADAEALAAALRRLLDLGPEGRRQLGAAGRSRVLGRFSISQIAERYGELYEEIADHGRYRCV